MKFNVANFVTEVRREVSKVTWPTRDETWWTTIAVVALVFGISLYFIISDSIIYFFVRKLLGIGARG